MKILNLAILTLALFSSSVIADNRLSFGAGLGVSYTGRGINISDTSDTDMKYISAGCHSDLSNSSQACGLGLGWIKTDLFGFKSNKHGFGGYLGTVGPDRSETEHKRAYGVGVSYHYFLRGIAEPGFNFGIAYLKSEKSDGSKVVFQAGYQF